MNLRRASSRELAPAAGGPWHAPRARPFPRAGGMAGALRVGAIIGAAVAVGVLAAGYPETWRLALAVGVGVNLLVLANRWPSAAVYLTLMLLPFLGLTRR